MHDFFANAKFTLTPGTVPLPDGESTPPMESIMRSFDDAEIIPFSQNLPDPRNSRSRSSRSRSRRKRPSSVFRSLSSVL